MRTRSTGVISSSRVRIGLIFRALPIQARAPPMRPPRRRYSRVSIANHIFRSLRVSSAWAMAAGRVGAVQGGGRGAERAEAHAAGGRARVQHVDPLAALVFLDQPLARLVGGLEGAGDAGRDVDRDDFPAGVEQRLVDLEEVADRGLRGGRPALRGAQPLVEGVEVGDVRLALLLAVDRDVEADRLDAPLGQELGGQVAGRVADDRGLGWRAHKPILDAPTNPGRPVAVGQFEIAPTAH